MGAGVATDAKDVGGETGGRLEVALVAEASPGGGEFVGGKSGTGTLATIEGGTSGTSDRRSACSRNNAI
eukprot:5080504-Pyramimonas_sp.AAC.1